MAWRCRFLTARRSQHGRVIVERYLVRAPDWLISTQAPKTLKTNLVKLAKNNGAELGFLS